MFTSKKTWGDHTVYGYDAQRHRFREYFIQLYGQTNLDMLHLQSKDFQENQDNLTSGVMNDLDTDLHQKFYANIKSSDQFKKLYCQLIRDIHQQFFPEEEMLVYQSYPSIRLQFMESVAVPPHCDSDEIGNHPIGEKNFVLPITRMYGTNTIFIESKPGRKDFQGIELEYGDLFSFNGNTCVHYNKENTEGRLRISLDFRVILLEDYQNYLDGGITTTNPRDPKKRRRPVDMVIGGYYQVCSRGQSFEEMLTWFSIREPIVQSRPNFDHCEADAAHKYLTEGGYITEYKKTQEFERALAAYIGVKHCIMTTNGTTALTLALLSLDIGEGDEVIVPNYTMIATANAVKSVGAIPVFAEVDPNTFTLTCSEVEKCLSEKTAAVIHVSLNNQCRDLVSMVKLCQKHSVHLIEDSAQSLGCRYENQHLGTFGVVGCFSLSTPKIISTGQGGFIVTNDAKVAAQARLIKNFGRKESGKDVYVTLGYNFKYTDLQAVIGLEQLKKLDGRVKRLREIYHLYYTQLKDFYNISPPPFEGWIPWFVTLLVPDRERLSRFLQLHKVQTRFTYPSIVETDVYRSLDGTPSESGQKPDRTPSESGQKPDRTPKEYPISKDISQRGLFLPTHSLLTDTDILFVCHILKVYALTHVSTVEIMFSGGLGNHIFNYNFAYMLAKLKGCALVFGKNNSRDKCYQEAFCELFPDANEIPGKITHVKQIFIAGQAHNVQSYCHHLGKITLRSGAFQKYYQYIKPYAHLIPEWSRINPDIKTVVEPGPNDLVVHVRLGDGVITPLDYFEKAIDEEPHENLYFVTDLPGHAGLVNLAKKKNGIIISKNNRVGTRWYVPPENMNHDFVLMTKAHKLVISQSTFSWWAAYLSKAKRIYVPSRKRRGLWTERGIGLLIHDDPRWILL